MAGRQSGACDRGGFWDSRAVVESCLPGEGGGSRFKEQRGVERKTAEELRGDLGKG